MDDLVVDVNCSGTPKYMGDFNSTFGQITFDMVRCGEWRSSQVWSIVGPSENSSISEEKRQSAHEPLYT